MRLALDEAQAAGSQILKTVASQLSSSK